MGLAQYSIVPVSDQWSVLHDGNVNGEYATKESAFESAIAAASLAVRQGHEVHVSVPGRQQGGGGPNQRSKVAAALHADSEEDRHAPWRAGTHHYRTVLRATLAART
jgi:hypothetical protein